MPRADKAYIYSFAQLYSSYKNNATETLHAWAPPVPKLHVPAESAIVMLRPQPGGDEEELVVAMHKMRVEEFERTLAIDAEAHKMDWYLEELKAWNGGR